jgi:DNA invertase Pin-like site-specific DNA recombinase
VERLERDGIGFQSLTEAISTSTPGGKFAFHLFGSLAEFERALIRDRTMGGPPGCAAAGTCRRSSALDD